MNKIVVAAVVHTLTPHDVLNRFDFFKDATGKYHTVIKCALDSTLSTKNMDNNLFSNTYLFQVPFHLSKLFQMKLPSLELRIVLSIVCQEVLKRGKYRLRI